MKKLTRFLLVLAMLCCMMAVTAHAAENACDHSVGGPCDSCGGCPPWPWPWPPMPVVMPSDGGYVYGSQTTWDNGNKESGGCSHCASDTNYTSHKNCYHPREACNDACTARQVKPIVDCSGCKHRCDCDD